MNLETVATLYQKDRDRFHLMLRENETPRSITEQPIPLDQQYAQSRLIWLELSPSRVIMTIQGRFNMGYRHLWEEGIYGVSRYWSAKNNKENHSFRLRNFTHHLEYEGNVRPEKVRVEYELWSDQLRIGSYVLSLEIQN
jgi:hypothetical protein